MEKIKVGVVGTGFIGPAHIEALRRLPNVEVAALCEVTAELAKQKADSLGIARSYTFDELLKQDDIQSIHICTPNFLHYSQSKAALEAGKARGLRKTAGQRSEGSRRTGRAGGQVGFGQCRSLQFAVLPAGASDAGDASERRFGRGVFGDRFVFAGLAFLQYRLQLAARTR
jgi:hypothetical protein